MVPDDLRVMTNVVSIIVRTFEFLSVLVFMHSGSGVIRTRLPVMAAL